MWGSIAIAIAIVGVGLGAWAGWRIHGQRPLEQFVKLTQKRHAELIDLERRQHDEE